MWSKNVHSKCYGISENEKNFQKCLSKIDTRLLEHVKNTRGHLFTEQRPTLACNQKILFTQIDTMLAELDGKDPGSISVGQVPIRTFRNPAQSSGFPFRGQPRFRGQPFRGYPRPSYPRPSYQTSRPPFARNARDSGSGCIRCLEARRYDASKLHTLKECTYPRMQPASNTAGIKVLLVQDQSSSTAPASTSQTSDIGPQATNQNDPYMGNEHYDENYYGNADG